MNNFEAIKSIDLKTFIICYSGSLVTSAVLIGLNFGVSYLLELFHKKPSSYGLKKTSWEKKTNIVRCTLLSVFL